MTPIIPIDNIKYLVLLVIRESAFGKHELFLYVI